MPFLARCADELDALADRSMPIGSRDPEAIPEAVSELRNDMRRLAAFIRKGGASPSIDASRTNERGARPIRAGLVSAAPKPGESRGQVVLVEVRRRVAR